MKLSSAIILDLFCKIGSVKAVTTIFFNSAQTIQLITAGTTSDTYTSEGYLITATRDKLFTGGGGQTVPIGRNLRVF